MKIDMEIKKSDVVKGGLVGLVVVGITSLIAIPAIIQQRRFEKKKKEILEKYSKEKVVKTLMAIPEGLDKEDVDELTDAVLTRYSQMVLSESDDKLKDAQEDFEILFNTLKKKDVKETKNLVSFAKSINRDTKEKKETHQKRWEANLLSKTELDKFRIVSDGVNMLAKTFRKNS